MKDSTTHDLGYETFWGKNVYSESSYECTFQSTSQEYEWSEFISIPLNINSQLLFKHFI